MRFICTAFAFLVVSGRANAALTHHCEFDPALYDFADPTPEYPWHDPETIVPVYTSEDDPPWAAVGASRSDFEYQLERILAVQNEQFGITVRLRYIGATASPASGFVDGALIVVGGNSCGDGYGFADVASKNVNGRPKWKGARISLQKYLGCPTSDPNNLVHWTTVEQQNANETDVGLVLLHEIGHAVWGFDHPFNEANSNCEDFGQYSYMFNYGDPGHPPAWRTIKNYDAEVAQFWYGVRSSTSQIRNSHYDALNTWSIPQVATDIDKGCGTDVSCGAGPGLMFRMGSMTNGITDRTFSYIGSPFDVSPWDGGTGILYSVLYKDGPSTKTNLFLDPNAGFQPQPIVLRRPPGVAAKPGTFHAGPHEVLLAYQEYAFGGTNPDRYGASSDIGRICYIRSTDSGIHWSAPACGFSSRTTPFIVRAYSRRYGVTVAYDPYSDAFLIGYISDSYLGSMNPTSCILAGTTCEDRPSIAVYTVPAIGSNTPPNLTVLGGTALEAPSIACSGAPNGCRIVWSDFVTGRTVWYEAGVSPTTGDVSATAAFIDTHLLFDTPSVAYNPPDQSFKLATTTNNDAIYSYTMTSSETSWTGTGDVWNDSQSFVSSGVISIRDELASYRTFVWFPQYF